MPEFRSENLLSSGQLIKDLPPVLFLIVEKMAVPIFPGSTRAAPARTVVVRILEQPKTLKSVRTRFDGTQWNSVAVPVLQDIRTWGWRGLPKPPQDELALVNDIYAVDSFAFREGSTFGLRNHTVKSAGKTYPVIDDYLNALAGLVRLQAQEAGY